MPRTAIARPHINASSQGGLTQQRPRENGRAALVVGVRLERRGQRVQATPFNTARPLSIGRRYTSLMFLAIRLSNDGASRSLVGGLQHGDSGLP